MNKLHLMNKSGSDELYTPNEAVEMLLPFLPPRSRIWESACIESSKIRTVLLKAGHTVIGTHLEDGYDFFDYEPAAHYDIQITNPPYSLKTEWLKKSFENGKPFALLLPLTALEGKARHELFRDKKLQLILPNKRFSFRADRGSNWFQTSWFTHGLNLKNDLNFISV